MNFDSDAQRDVYQKVREWMKELFGMFVTELPDIPAFGFQQGDTLAQIAVVPWANDDATITVRSWVIHDVEVTADLMHFLLRENDTFRFGGFGLDSEEDVFFEHTIVGSTCDPEELKASVLAVAGTSGRYAAKMVPQFGGMTSADKLRQKIGI